MSEISDPHLTKKSHIIYEGRPLLHTRIGIDGVQHVTQILRWGRGLRFLGVVRSNVESKGHFAPASEGLFICDAFDADSFVVMPFAGLAV